MQILYQLSVTTISDVIINIFFTRYWQTKYIKHNFWAKCIFFYSIFDKLLNQNIPIAKIAKSQVKPNNVLNPKAMRESLSMRLKICVSSSFATNFSNLRELNDFITKTRTIKFERSIIDTGVNTPK